MIAAGEDHDRAVAETSAPFSFSEDDDDDEVVLGWKGSDFKCSTVR